MAFWNKKEETADRTTWAVETDTGKGADQLGEMKTCEDNRDKTPMEVLQEKVKGLEESRLNTYRLFNSQQELVQGLHQKIDHQRTLINLLIGLLEKKEQYVEPTKGHFILVDVEKPKPEARKR